MADEREDLLATWANGEPAQVVDVVQAGIRDDLREAGERLRRIGELLERRYARVEGHQMRQVANGASGLSPQAGWLWVVLQAYGWHGNWAHPSDKTLAEASGIGSARTVRRLLLVLEVAGWIERRTVPTAKGRGRELRLLCLPGSGGGLAKTDGGSGHQRPDGCGHQWPSNTSSSGDLLGDSPPPPAHAGGAGGGAAPKGRASKPVPEWALTLARQLGEVYPHGVTETGRVRRPGPTQVARRLVQAFFCTSSDERARLGAQVLAAAHAEAKARPPGSEDRRYSKGLDVWVHQRCWEAPAEVVAGGGEVSPCEASWRHSAAKAERERQARHAADPTRTPPEAVPPEVLARLEAERASALARLEASRQEALARARLIADQPGHAGDAARHLLASAGEAPAGPVAASAPATGSEPRHAHPSDPASPGGPRARRPRRPRAEVLAELEEHRRKIKPDGEGVSRVG